MRCVEDLSTARASAAGGVAGGPRAERGPLRFVPALHPWRFVPPTCQLDVRLSALWRPRACVTVQQQMEVKDEAHPRSRFIPIGALIVMGAIITLMRLHTFDEPLEPDLVTYATIGHEMVKGERLYSDIWDVKPPGLYATYAATELIVGHGAREIFFLGLISALGTLLAVYAAGTVLGPAAGLWAAVFWTALSGTLVLQANQPNSEVFINGCCMGGFALMVRHPPGRAAWARVIGAAALFAIGSTYKQVALATAALVAAAHVLCPPAKVSRKTAMGEIAIFGLTGATVWGLIFGYAIATGQGSIYWTTIVTVNGDRAAGLLFNLYRYVREGKVLPRTLLFLIPLLAFVTAAAYRGLRHGPSRPWVMFGALVLGAHAMLFLQGGAFHPHSYQFWLPVAALGAGWAVPTVAAWARPRPGLPDRHVGTVAASLAASFALAVVLAHEVPNYLQPPEEWARRKYGDQIVQERAFARELRAVLLDRETLFEYGNDAALYYYTGLRPSTPTIWLMHLLNNSSVSRRLGDQTLAELEARPPDLFVVQLPDGRPAVDPAPAATPGLAARLLGGARPAAPNISWDRHPIYAWAMAHYHPLPPQATLRVPKDLALYVRPGSALEERLGSPSGPR
jgi:hypothetical protein